MTTIALTTSRSVLNAQDTAVITFTLSQASSNFTREDVTVIGGMLSQFQGSGSSYTALFTPAAGATSAAVFVDSDRFSNAAGQSNADGADSNNTVSLRIDAGTTSTNTNTNTSTNTNTAPTPTATTTATTINPNIVRYINSNMSIRTGKFGHYIYFKKPADERPTFFPLKGFKGDYITCPHDELEEWIIETYAVDV